MANQPKKGFNKAKEGFSIQELEDIARKYTQELFIIIAIIIAATSTMVGFLFNTYWSISFASLGVIFSIGLPEKAGSLQKAMFRFLFKQDKPIVIVIGIIRIAVALFLPFMIFAELGILAGISFHHFQKCVEKGTCGQSNDDHPKSSNEEEHL